MKRKRFCFLIIAMAVVCLLTGLFACGFGHCLIGMRQVEKMELTACDPVGTSTVELQAEDVQRFIMCYNLSRFAGTVTADRCERTFYVSIHMKDGKQIGITDHDENRLKVTGADRENYWIQNRMLLTYIQDLANDYGLHCANWGC